jgi:hypothetical protein
MVMIEQPPRAYRPCRRRGGGWRSERDDRRRKRKSCTKAELRRRVRAQIGVAMKEIGISNRITIVPEKQAHLERAIAHLEAALEQRAGSHVLRHQLALCQELLWEIERGSPDLSDRQVEVVVEIC